MKGLSVAVRNSRNFVIAESIACSSLLPCIPEGSGQIMFARFSSRTLCTPVFSNSGTCRLCQTSEHRPVFWMTGGIYQADNFLGAQSL